MRVLIRRVHPDAVIPEYQTAGAAGFDIRALTAGSLKPGETITVGTGLAMAVPPGHVLLVFPRSGLGSAGLVLANTVGVIDSDYRGEIQLRLHRRAVAGDDRPIFWEGGDRLVQGVIVPCIRAEVGAAPQTPNKKKDPHQAGPFRAHRADAGSGGAKGSRTLDLVSANHALSQLSYRPVWVARPDSNRRPSEPQSDALAICATDNI